MPVCRHWECLGKGVVSLLDGKPLVIVLKKSKHDFFF